MLLALLLRNTPLVYIYMEDIYITNVKVQNVYCIKDAYGTLVWKTCLIDPLIKEAYGTLVWKTRLEDSSGRLFSKTTL